MQRKCDTKNFNPDILYIKFNTIKDVFKTKWYLTGSVAEPEPPFLAGAGAETFTLFRLRLRKVSFKSIFINNFFFVNNDIFINTKFF